MGLSSLHANAGREVLQRALCLFILTAGALQTRPKLQREREREADDDDDDESVTVITAGN